MYCMDCGTKNPDGATFCVSCGAPMVPTPNAPAPTPAKKGVSKKVLAIVAASLVGVVLLIVIIVAALSCSGNENRLNLDNLVKEDPENAAAYIENFEVVKLYQDAYYTQADMVDVMKTTAKIFEKDSSDGLDEVSEDIAKLSPWAVALFEEENDEEFKSLKLDDIQGKGDPSMAEYIGYRKLEDPTAEDFYNIVREIATIDSLTFGGSPTKDGKSNYGSHIYYFGCGKGPGTTDIVWVYETDGIYEIIVTVYNDGEIIGDKADSIVEKFEAKFDNYFDEEFAFPKK